jgi:hypothetical protein
MKKTIFWIMYLPIGILYLALVILPYTFFEKLQELVEEILDKYENWTFKD